MEKSESILEKVRWAARRRLLFLPHAARQMARPDRMITPNEVRMVVELGTLIEDYPEDARGRSFLMHGKGLGHRNIHAVCAPKEDFLAIIHGLPALGTRVGRRSEHQENQMKCIHCRGDMKSATAPFHVDRNGYHLMLDAVPAWVCDQCGEACFEGREVETIQATIRTLDRQTRQLSAHGAGTAS